MQPVAQIPSGSIREREEDHVASVRHSYPAFVDIYRIGLELLIFGHLPRKKGRLELCLTPAP